MTKWFLALAGAAALVACSSEAPEERPVTGAARRPACEGSLRITNSGTRPVRQVHFADSALSSFGRDRLGRDMLAPGETRDFRTDGPGPHDFRIVRLDGSTSDLRRANICTNTAIVITNFGVEAR